MKPKNVLGQLLLLTLSITMWQPSYAQNQEAAKEPQKNQRKVRRTQTMREVIYKRLEAAQKLADEKNYAGALDKLNALNEVRRNSYEQAMTWNMLAYVYFSQENFKKAASSYQQITQLKNVPEALQLSTYYSLAKLYLIEENYPQALQALNSWFAKSANASPEAHILRAQIYYQLEQYKKALPEVKKAVVMFQKQGKKPKENWLLLERAVYYQNNDYQAMERCLKDLIYYYPKAQYWQQLAAVYSELKKPKKELATLEAAYEQGLLEKEIDQVNLSQSLISQNAPYKAAQILLEGMQNNSIESSARNLSLLGDALMLAKEDAQAVKVMEQAAEKSQKAQDFYKLAQIYTQQQNYVSALGNINKAFKLGDLNRPGDALQLKGLVLFNLKRLDEAKLQFEKLKKVEGYQKTAEQWLAYIASEKQRLEYMSSAGSSH